jgi:hypothetical protein
MRAAGEVSPVNWLTGGRGFRWNGNCFGQGTATAFAAESAESAEQRGMNSLGHAPARGG